MELGNRESSATFLKVRNTNVDDQTQRRGPNEMRIVVCLRQLEEVGLGDRNRGSLYINFIYLVYLFVNGVHAIMVMRK